MVAARFNERIMINKLSEKLAENSDPDVSSIHLPFAVSNKGEVGGFITLNVNQLLERFEDNKSFPLVSCMLVTADRFELALRAIHCFQQQEYPNKELVIVDDGLDDRLERWVATLDSSEIFYYRLPAEGKKLGTLRNFVVDKSHGEYLTQWDDDDLSDSRRLRIQMAMLIHYQCEACFLQRVQGWIPASRRLFNSIRRLWEGSYICHKQLIDRFPALAKGEDTPVAEDLVRQNKIIVLDYPQLYTYVYHGENTWGEDHFLEHWNAASYQYEDTKYDEMVSQILSNAGVSEVRAEV